MRLHGELHVGSLLDAKALQIAFVDEEVLPVALNEAPTLPAAQVAEQTYVHDGYGEVMDII